MGTGVERQAVRLLSPQPARTRGDRRGAHGRAAVRAARPSPRRRGGVRRGARAGGVPVVRGRLPRQRRRPGADPAAAARLRCGPAGEPKRTLAHARAVRRARRTCLQHEDARRLSGRPRDRARLRRVRARVATTADRTAARRGPGDGGGVVRVDRVRRTHTRLQTPVRGQLHEQHRARPHLRIQRPRPRRRPDRRTEQRERPSRRLRARRPPTHGRRRRPCPHAQHATRISARAPRSCRQACARGQDHRQGKGPDPVRRIAPPATPVRHRPRRPGGLDAAVRAVRVDRPARAGRAGGRGPQARRAVGGRPRTAAGTSAIARFGAGARPPRPTPGHRARARRVVRGGGGGAEPVEGHRPPLLRLRARPRHRRDGRRRRRTRSSSSHVDATACGGSRSRPARWQRRCSCRSC